MNPAQAPRSRGAAPAAPSSSRRVHRSAAALLALALAGCSGGDDGGGLGEAFPPVAATVLSGSLAVLPISTGGAQLLEQEPNDSPSQVQFVGEIGPGAQFVISGESTDDGSDPFDGFRFRSTAPLALHAELLMLDETADLDLLVFDVEAGLNLCEFTDIVNPEVGDCVIPTAGFEFDLVVYSFTGTSSYVLTVTASAAEAATAAPAPPLAAAMGKTPDAIARYLGAHHAMAPNRIVVLEDEAAFQSPERALHMQERGLELVSRTADGTSIYALAPERADAAKKGAPGAWLDSLEHQLAREAWLAARRPGVRAASPDYVLRAHEAPNDTHYPLQWHYPQMRLPLAWNLATGSASVVVAVVDTGITPHPDLTARLIGGYDFISDPATSSDGDGMDPDPTDTGDGAGAQPSTFHGTHVSGTVGASSDDQAGVAGVDWGCRILSLRALGVGGGTLSDIAAAVKYAAGLPNASGALPAEPADVINMSLGGPGFSAVLQEACDQAFAAGVVLVASAGNQPDDLPKYPAAYESVIGVGAVRYDSQLAPYSSFGSWVDVVAPGGDLNADQNGDGFPDGVLSTHTNAQGEYFYAFQQGTSMASPHVAGICALLKGVDPAVTPTGVRNVLLATAIDLGAPGVDPVYGFGLVDAHAALVAQAGGGSPDPVLAVNPTAVNFGPFDSFFPVSLSNVGGGTLQLEGFDVEYGAGSGWAGATLTPSTVLTNISHGFLDVSVDRTGLDPGSYSATLVLHATGLPDQDVQVLMSVGGGELPDFTTFVLIVDADTFETVHQSVTDLSGAYEWSVGDVENGRYIVVAGTDEDDDGFIGDAGEPLFGLWPSALDPTVIRVEQPSLVEGLDFPVSNQSNIGTLSLEQPVGFARLR